MLRLRSPLCRSTVANSATAAALLRSLRAPRQTYSQSDASPPPLSEGRRDSRRSSPGLTSRLDFGHRTPRSQFGRNSFQRTEDEAPGRFDREQGSGDRGGRGGRSFSRGRDPGDRRSSYRSGGARMDRDDKSFYSEPLAKEPAEDAPYKPPTPKFTTNPKCVPRSFGEFDPHSPDHSWASDAERSAWLSQHGVRMFGENAPAPIRTWAEIGLPEVGFFPAPLLRTTHVP